MPSYVKSREWNEHLERQLEDILHLHNPVALVFDGGFPYAGMMEEMWHNNQFSRI